MLASYNERMLYINILLNYKTFHKVIKVETSDQSFLITALYATESIYILGIWVDLVGLKKSYNCY